MEPLPLAMMLTTTETCRQQKTNLFDFVAEAVAAHVAHRTGPSHLSSV
jgi:hypothetical protein